MKKWYIFLFVLLILAGCQEKVDYSGYPFVGVSWERTTEYDTEMLHFGADGSFGYSCACGNPVNDADLCEGYTYDHQTKTITLKFDEPMPYTVDTIVVVECTDTRLALDFEGEIREFTRE